MATNTEHLTLWKAVHPGQIIKRELEARGISQRKLATDLNISVSHFNEVIQGKRAMSAELAVCLESALGIPYRTWMKLQSEYDYDVIAIAERDRENATASGYESACRAQVNLTAIYKRLDIAKSTAAERVKALKAVLPFDLLDIGGYQPCVAGLYKHSEKVQIDEKNMLSWLVLNKYETLRYDLSALPEYRNGNARLAAEEIAGYANRQELTPSVLEDTLNKYGIAYLVVRKLDKAPVNAFCTMRDGHPFVTVTYRYNDIDKLAFDVLHELCHIDRHLGNGQEAFVSLDGADYSGDPREKEANEFARETLIPKKDWDKILRTESASLLLNRVVATIATAALNLGYSPSIAVARYKRETQNYCTSLYRSRKIETGIATR